MFTVVFNGGPAEAAGVAPGDVAVALDGIALRAANADKRLRAYRAGDTLELVLFRGDELLTTRLCLADSPADTCYLKLDAEADADTKQRRDAWLHVE